MPDVNNKTSENNSPLKRSRMFYDSDHNSADNYYYDFRICCLSKDKEIATAQTEQLSISTVISLSPLNEKTIKQLTGYRKKTKKPAPKPAPKYDVLAVARPMQMGWNRELVHRKNGVQSDVYYFTPHTNKLRSMNEVKKYLEVHNITDLSPRNFTFAKELVVGFPFEKERLAKGGGEEV